MNVQWDLIISALENPKYKWRTINGISKEINIDSDIIEKELHRHADIIIKSSIPSTHGEDLYTTRDHYRKKSSIIQRITSSIINKPST